MGVTQLDLGRVADVGKTLVRALVPEGALRDAQPPSGITPGLHAALEELRRAEQALTTHQAILGRHLDQRLCGLSAAVRRVDRF
ncbi:MAG: hypothetical protein JJT89_03685 [Nitriliruptoraceae bacterium]|nr:hypothetical protein [Nitriliruptoraceae bacterium]